jgi:hypothetical protein
MLMGGNPIRQTVDPATMTITNVTLPGHVFGGQVQILITNSNGVSGVQIQGSGAGPNAALNQFAGPIIFEILALGAYANLNPQIGSLP